MEGQKWIDYQPVSTNLTRIIKKGREHNLSLIQTLKERLEVVGQGGGGKYVERHRGRGKNASKRKD